MTNYVFIDVILTKYTQNDLEMLKITYYFSKFKGDMDVTFSYVLFKMTIIVFPLMLNWSKTEPR